MSKPTLLINKGGSVFFTREEAKRASAVGEQGETEGTIRHLAERDDIRLVYFGNYRGEPLCDIVEPSIDGFDELTSETEQEEGWERDYEALKQYEPIIGLIHVAGYSPTMSWVGNPKYTTVQASSIRYQAPQLQALERFKIPRLVVNNDPRTYPKDQEMSLGWEYTRPRALLDQCEAEVKCVVGGRQYLRKSVWARPESWAYHIRGDNTDELSCVCIAHAHIKDGCKMRGRDAAWQTVLGGELPDGLRVYGKGWEHFSGYDPEVMLGPVRPNKVVDILRTASCCPCVSAGPGFYTGKVYVCEAQGCIPLLYGDGTDPFTWDPKGVFLDLDSEWRITEPGRLRVLVDALHGSRETRDQLRAFWREACQPDYTMLDELVDELVSGVDTTSRSWFNRFGGYWPL